jgi:hypothetical protein
MKASKKLGIKVYRKIFGGWGVRSDRGDSGEKSVDNKGIAVLEFLKTFYEWDGKAWR